MRTKDVTLKPLNDILQKYGEEVQDLVFATLDQVAKDTVKEVKSNSPERTGRYKKGWSKTTIDKDWKGITVTVYNKTLPGLTHLLNDGHALRKGGRTNGDHHIDMAEDYAQERLEEIVLERLSKL